MITCHVPWSGRLLPNTQAPRSFRVRLDCVALKNKQVTVRKNFPERVCGVNVADFAPKAQSSCAAESDASLVSVHSPAFTDGWPRARCGPRARWHPGRTDAPGEAHVECGAAPKIRAALEFRGVRHAGGTEASPARAAQAERDIWAVS